MGQREGCRLPLARSTVGRVTPWSLLFWLQQLRLTVSANRCLHFFQSITSPYYPSSGYCLPRGSCKVSALFRWFAWVGPADWVWALPQKCDLAWPCKREGHKWASLETLEESKEAQKQHHFLEIGSCFWNQCIWKPNCTCSFVSGVRFLNCHWQLC